MSGSSQHRDVIHRQESRLHNGLYIISAQQVNNNETTMSTEVVRDTEDL